MHSKDPIVSFNDFDENQLVADVAEVEKHIPHRHQMRLIDGILFECAETMRCVGVRTVRDDEFWVSGHFPGKPIMPGIVACECAAQVSAYYASKFKLFGGVMGLGSLDSVKFRGPIRPGDRLILMIARERFRKNMLFKSQFQIFVNQTLVTEGIIKGVPLPDDAI